MSDRIPAAIWIGGQLSRKLVPEFIAAINIDDPSLEWGDASFSPKTAQDLLDARTEFILVLKDDEARQGVFQSIEDFCIAYRIPFDRQSNGKWEFDAELVRHRPDFGIHEMNCTQAGVPCVQVSELQRLFGENLQRLRKCPGHVKDKLYEACGLHFPELERFDIVP